MTANSGNLKTPQQKFKVLAGLWAALRLMFMLIVVPLTVPVLGWLVQAAVWTFVLGRIDGIGFSGTFKEALALSAALGTFATALSLSLLSLQDIPVLKKYFFARKSAVKASAAVNDLKTWQDFGRTLPSGKQFLKQCAINAAALLAFSHLQPVALNFDSFALLALSSLVLSAFWTLSMTFISTIMFALVLKPQADSARTL